ncbi:MAG: SAM-dependent DNA methyltransferase [Deltaproteobacteria bacterium]|nr:SAM-dependent DNA methyltransferase [Deltaproteobacteria bacterium]
MLAGPENLVEARRQAVQAALDSSKSAAERNRLGQFATPNALAIDIARYVRLVAGRLLSPVRFADPAIGTGSFYSAALAVFGRQRVESAVGVELDAGFCDAARDLWAQAGLKVVQGDFTHIVAGPRRPVAPNLVLTNPPYVRHHHLGRQDKERLQALAYRMTGVRVNGLAGLYVYFLLLATAWMEDGGYAAWLVPSEFMDVNYGAALRRYLTDCVTLIRAHRFDPDDVQFGDALVSSVVLVLRKALPPPAHAVQFTFGGTLGEPHASDAIPLQQLRESRKWTGYPSHARNDRRRSSNGDGSTLGDFFRIQRGIATGSNKFFVLDRCDAERRRIPKRYLRPILPSPRFLTTTVIDADKDGYPLIERQLCVVDCDLPEAVVQTRHPALWEYLQTAEALGIKRGYLVGKRSPWYKQERRDPAPFLCTYMGRGSDQKRPFRFIWNRSQAIGTNLYLMLYPKAGLARLLLSHPDRAADVFALLGQVTGHELRGEGRVYGGGLNKIEPGELARISAVAFVERWPELGSAVPRQGELFGERGRESSPQRRAG